MPNPIVLRRILKANTSSITYLIRDEFTTDRTAGAINGTAAEPGPGTRTVTDGNSKLSISGGQLSFATGGAGGGNPSLHYELQNRVPGLLLVSAASYTLQGLPYIGWDNNTTTTPVDALSGLGGTTLNVRRNSAAISAGVIATSTTYRLITIQRATGMMYLVSGGAFTYPTLLYISDNGSGNFYPTSSTVVATLVATVDYIRVIASGWLPVPLVSGGFGSTWETSDGLGHAEGVAGGVGAGGGSVSWTQQIGTWANSSGSAAASALSGGVAVATAASGKADVIVTAEVTRSAGNAGISARWSDSSNYVFAYHDGTNAVLVKKVAGVDTTLVNAAATYSAGAELRLIIEGTKFRLYYNNALIGSEQTISDSALQSGTGHGLYTTNTSNTFDDFTVYARGTGGEYSILDTY